MLTFTYNVQGSVKILNICRLYLSTLNTPAFSCKCACKSLLGPFKGVGDSDNHLVESKTPKNDNQGNEEKGDLAAILTEKPIQNC